MMQASHMRHHVFAVKGALIPCPFAVVPGAVLRSADMPDPGSNKTLTESSMLPGFSLRLHTDMWVLAGLLPYFISPVPVVG